MTTYANFKKKRWREKMNVWRVSIGYLSVNLPIFLKFTGNICPQERKQMPIEDSRHFAQSERILKC